MSSTNTYIQDATQVRGQVPEPGSIVSFLGLALVGGVLVRRRRK